MKTSNPFVPLLSALAVGALSGCVNFKPVEDLTRFYVLTAQAPRESLPGAARLTNLVFVAAVETPAYLDNPRIAVRRDEHRLDYSDLQQWGEPLRESVSRGLRDNLAALLGNERVHPLSRRRPAGDVIEVQVSLSRFELASDHSARLVADWRLVRTKRGEVLAARHTDERRAYRDSPSDFTPAVTALSETLATLSREIASTLVQVVPSAARSTFRPRARGGSLYDFHLVMDTIDRLPQTGDQGIYLKQQLREKLIEHKQYIDKNDEDVPEIRNWKWSNLR
jgi:uncharacterized lipoprotein YmbA